MSNKVLIGITGGIGSGKSLISKYLSCIGECVIDADEAAREAVMPGEKGSELIRNEFGYRFFREDGSLKRKMLAEYVFADKARLLKLNEILHPLIIDIIYRKAQDADSRVFIEAPLLIQADMHNQMDYVWLVVADLETRIKRVMERDESDKASVMQRIESQMSDDDMSVYADEIIENSGSQEDLYLKIDTLLKKPEYSR